MAKKAKKPKWNFEQVAKWRVKGMPWQEIAGRCGIEKADTMKHKFLRASARRAKE